MAVKDTDLEDSRSNIEWQDSKKILGGSPNWLSMSHSVDFCAVVHQIVEDGRLGKHHHGEGDCDYLCR